MTKEEIMAKAHARHMFVYELRNQKLTFKEIGEKINVCAGRARQIYVLTERMINRKNQGYGY